VHHQGTPADGPTGHVEARASKRASRCAAMRDGRGRGVAGRRPTTHRRCDDAPRRAAPYTRAYDVRRRRQISS